jgi:hypothetical protein
MKVTKSSVHRLTVEKACGCKAIREYSRKRLPNQAKKRIGGDIYEGEKGQCVSFGA